MALNETDRKKRDIGKVTYQEIKDYPQHIDIAKTHDIIHIILFSVFYGQTIMMEDKMRIRKFLLHKSTGVTASPVA